MEADEAVKARAEMLEKQRAVVGSAVMLWAEALNDVLAAAIHQRDAAIQAGFTEHMANGMGFTAYGHLLTQLDRAYRANL